MTYPDSATMTSLAALALGRGLVLFNHHQMGAEVAPNRYHHVTDAHLAELVSREWVLLDDIEDASGMPVSLIVTGAGHYHLAKWQKANRVSFPLTKQRM